MPTAPTHIRSRTRAATLLSAVSLAVLANLIAPFAAPASDGHRTHAASRRHIVHPTCVLKRSKKSSSHRGRSRGCPTTKGTTKTTAQRGTKSGGLTVEEIGVSALTSLPTAPGAPSEGSTSAKSKSGNSSANAPGNLPVESGEVVNDPIDARFLTDVPFGTRSFWLQPWRAYLDTWPSSRLLESVGINFNVRPADAEDTAQLLQDTGFKLARIGISWSALSYEQPTEFLATHLASITTRLTALHKHDLRPLIVLDANSGAPTPEIHLNLETTAAAPAGAQTVTLSAASAAAVVPGKSGFNGLTFSGNPDILITSVNASHVATLSRTLPNSLPAGAHSGTTLLYAPFTAPELANGEPNPAFQATLAGWLNYVAAVCKEAASIVGPGGYDLEVWNELSFGSQFLNAENYDSSPGEEHTESAYDLGTENGVEAETSSEAAAESEASVGPETETGTESENGPEAEGELEAEGGEAEAGATPQTQKAVPHKRTVTKEVEKAMLDETVAYVRNPANGISPSVGITDGFASQSPFPSGANAPLGLTALSKHPYVGPKDFPSEYHANHIAPIDALGARDTATKQSFAPLFVPAYQSLLPEYTLTATSTETLVRDLAPFTTEIYHEPHGRNVGPVGGSPVQKWVTEYNLGIGKAHVVGPDEVTPQTGASATITPADKEHFQAKVALRSLVSMVSKGISREYFFAAAPGDLSLISKAFFSAVEADPNSYPGDALGGETMNALRNTLTHFQGPGAGGSARALTLLSIAQDGNHAQFTGDGTSAHPSLYDRDVLAVFPFQTSPTTFVIPVYVMTRDLLTLYEPSAPSSDINRFDLPNETFRITLGNLPETGTAPSVSAYDPLRNQSTPARLVSREGSQGTFEFAATDYPRLLTIEYPA